MDLIRRYFNTIKMQLSGLTISQKLLIGLLAVVMVATIFFTVIFSAKPAMVPLIAQPMSAEEINRAEMALKGKYDYTVSADKILVPAEQAYEIRGDLASQQALPRDLSTAFRAVAMDSNPFKTEGMQERQWNNATQEELTRYLRSFPYIEDGSVIIAHGERAGLGTPMMPSTATVNVKVKGGAPLTPNQLMAIVEMVSGAVSGMKRDAVHVVDGERAYHAPSADTPIPADLLEFKKTMEEDYTRKLYNMFEHYGDVKIAVNIVPDLSQRVREVKTYDPKDTVVKPLTETNRDTNSTEGAGAEGQPGVPPNTQMTVADSSGGGRKQSSTTSDTSTTNVVNVGQTTERETLPPGVEFKELTASLTLPRSYFVSAYRRIKGDQKLDPKDEELQPVIDAEIKKARGLAKNTIGAKSDDQVQVDWFDDEIVARGTEMPRDGGALAAAGMPGLIAQYAKQGVLAIVAPGTLGMMLMMVKRAVPGGDDVSVEAGVFYKGGKGGKGKRKQGEIDQLDSGDDVYGEANEGDAVLTGIELDDETLQSRKMVDEVSIMIKENPENAATLVKRWMAKSK